MKNLILLLGIFASVNLWANPSGSYYAPHEENGEDYSPEQLFVFTDSTLTVSHVENGARIVTTSTFKTLGDKIIFSASEKPEVKWNCNGEEVTYEAESAPEVMAQYTVDSRGITLQAPEITFSMQKATEEQIARIQSLPVCSKK